MPGLPAAGAAKRAALWPNRATSARSISRRATERNGRGWRRDRIVSSRRDGVGVISRSTACGGGSSSVLSSATSACSDRSAASSMMTTRLRPSSGRRARSCCISRICSIVMFLRSSRFAWSTSRVISRTSGCRPRSIFRQARQTPHPPGLIGSVAQLSVCANRVASVCFPIDRGPLSSYPWATSPRTARPPSLASRRRCPITSRTGRQDCRSPLAECLDDPAHRRRKMRRESVVGPDAASGGLDQAGLAELCHVMRDRRLRQVERSGEVADTDRFLRGSQRQDHLKAGRVGERLEHVGDLRGAHVRNLELDGATHARSEEHTSELQSPDHLVCRLLLEKKKQTYNIN